MTLARAVLALCAAALASGCGITSGFEIDAGCNRTICDGGGGTTGSGGTRQDPGDTTSGGVPAVGSASGGVPFVASGGTPTQAPEAGKRNPDASTEVDAGGPRECEAGDTRSCGCHDAGEGFQVCHPDGHYGACVCSRLPTADAGAAAAPNTEPFTAGAYLQGTTDEGLCGTDALQRFWPSLSSSYYAGFDCYAAYYVFRMSDGVVFYDATFEGLHRDVTGSSQDPVVPTPPCDQYVKRRVGFDAKGTLHYVCSESLMRDGTDVTEYVDQLVAVLADGRFVITTTHPDGVDTDYIAQDAAGHELSRLRTNKELTGDLTLAVDAATVADNRAYVAVLRTAPDGAKEIVAYRLTDASEWQPVTRAPVDTFGESQLVVSDGTIFVRDDDPGTDYQKRIRAFQLDGTVHTVWREKHATVVREHIGGQMLVGPRTPSGPSVVAR